MKVKDFVIFFYKNRRGGVFKDSPVWFIVDEITKAIDTFCLFYEQDEQGQLKAVVLCCRDCTRKVIEIRNIISLERNLLHKLLIKGLLLYPDYKFVASRYGKHVEYNTKRLHQLILANKL